MDERSPEFLARAKQLREILAFVDMLPPVDSPRARIAWRSAWLVAFAIFGLGMIASYSMGVTLVLAAAGGLATNVAIRRFGMQQAHVISHLDSLLVSYDPTDKEAYRELQSRVTRHGYSALWFKKWWISKEAIALLKKHGLPSVDGCDQAMKVDAPGLEVRIAQLKGIEKAASRIQVGMNPRLQFAAFFGVFIGLAVLGLVEFLEWLDIASGRGARLAPPVLALLAMFLYYLFSTRPKSLLPKLKMQLADYVPLRNEDYCFLLASTHVYGWRAEKVKEWAEQERHELEELEALETMDKRLPESSFVRKKV